MRSYLDDNRGALNRQRPAVGKRRARRVCHALLRLRDDRERREKTQCPPQKKSDCTVHPHTRTEQQGIGSGHTHEAEEFDSVREKVRAEKHWVVVIPVHSVSA